jgi:hypothetical protein
VNRGFRWLRDGPFRAAHAPRDPRALSGDRGCRGASWPQVALFIRGDVQWRFFDAPEQATVTGNFAMLPGATPRGHAGEMMREPAGARSRIWRPATRPSTA